MYALGDNHHQRLQLELTGTGIGGAALPWPAERRRIEEGTPAPHPDEKVLVLSFLGKVDLSLMLPVAAATGPLIRGTRLLLDTQLRLHQRADEYKSAGHWGLMSRSDVPSTDHIDPWRVSRNSGANALRA